LPDLVLAGWQLVAFALSQPCSKQAARPQSPRGGGNVALAKSPRQRKQRPWLGKASRQLWLCSHGSIGGWLCHSSRGWGSGRLFLAYPQRGYRADGPTVVRAKVAVRVQPCHGSLWGSGLVAVPRFPGRGQWLALTCSPQRDHHSNRRPCHGSCEGGGARPARPWFPVRGWLVGCSFLVPTYGLSHA